MTLIKELLVILVVTMLGLILFIGLNMIWDNSIAPGLETFLRSMMLN